MDEVADFLEEHDNVEFDAEKDLVKQGLDALPKNFEVDKMPDEDEILGHLAGMQDRMLAGAELTVGMLRGAGPILESEMVCLAWCRSWQELAQLRK